MDLSSTFGSSGAETVFAQILRDPIADGFCLGMKVRFVPHCGHCGRLRLHLQSAEKKVEVELCGSSDSDASFGDILGAALKSDD